MRLLLAIFTLLVGLAPIGCNLDRPWQPSDPDEPRQQELKDTIAKKEAEAIGAYNVIPDGLGAPERFFLENLAQSLPRAAEFRVWQEKHEPTRIARLAFRSLGLKSRKIAEIQTSAFVSLSGRGIRQWNIVRSARYTPASWDYDFWFEAKEPTAMAAREINRLHAILGSSPLQGKVYLDSTQVSYRRITASLRDRLAKTTRGDEADIVFLLKKAYRGFKVSFHSRDVMDGEILKQRIYDVEISGDFRGLPAETPKTEALRWSPDGGPKHDPTPADTDPNRRLIERENAKYRK